jgi:hypothetical protein
VSQVSPPSQVSLPRILCRDGKSIGGTLRDTHLAILITGAAHLVECFDLVESSWLISCVEGVVLTCNFQGMDSERYCACHREHYAFGKSRRAIA